MLHFSARNTFIMLVGMTPDNSVYFEKESHRTIMFRQEMIPMSFILQTSSLVTYLS
jgi:hypothetical protein